MPPLKGPQRCSAWIGAWSVIRVAGMRRNAGDVDDLQRAVAFAKGADRS